MKIKLLIFLLLASTNLYSFKSLSDIRAYAEYYPEEVESDYSDWANPTYNTFYKKVLKISHIKRAVMKVGRFFGLTSFVEFDIHAFEKLLDKTVIQIVPEKLIETKEGDRYFVFGDLHAAFHSLHRDLSELYRLGEIDENLVLKDKNAKFIFIGDYISRYPYSLPLLHVLLRLIERNPGKVILLAGNHEKNGYWEGFSMRQELLFYLGLGGRIYKGGVPLVKKLNSFFELLPRFISIKHKNVDEKLCCSYKVAKKFFDDKSVRVFLHGEERAAIIKERNGLHFVGYRGNFSRWSILSCPTSVYKKFFNFYHDAFVEVSIGKSITESVLTLHDRDARKGDFKTFHYNPIFGYRLKEKKNVMDGKTIVTVGCTAALSGVIGVLGSQSVTGVIAALTAFNKEENDFLVRLVVFDDEYIPRLTLQNVKMLRKKYGIDMFLTPTGTSTLLTYIDMVKNGEIAVFFPYTGAVQFRKPDIKNVIHFMASYELEARQLIRHVITKYDSKRVALFYQDDGYGAPMARVARDEMKKHGITEWLDLPHFVTQDDYKGIIEKIRAFVPDSIVCFSVRVPTEKLITQMGTASFLNKLVFCTSDVYSGAFKIFLDNRGLKFVFSFSVPDPKSDRLEIQRDHREHMYYLGKHPDAGSMLGYISAMLFIEALKNISPPYTKEKLLAYFETMQNYKFKGLSFTFNSEARELGLGIWISE